MPPNVLWVVFDTARADVFEPYGAAVGSTPTVAQLARSGAAAPHAVAPCNWTVPSHAAMFTGLLPRTLGLAQVPGGRPDGCRAVLERHRDRLFAAVLQQRGWSTAAISANLWISEASGFDIGFDRFESVVGHRVERVERLQGTGPRARLTWALEALLSRGDDGATAAEEHLRRWAQEPRRQPFFWFVNLIECHSPYLPPRPYNDLGPLARVRAADEARRHLNFDAVMRACAGRFEIPGPALHRMRHLYGRSIQLMDDWLARVLELLDSRRLLDDTIVIVTSDHGENLGEGELIGHAFSLDQRLIGVPLVVSGPGRWEHEPVTSLAALPRLVADALGIDDHPWAEDEFPAGPAVAQIDPILSASDPRAAQSATDWQLDEEGFLRLTAPVSCAFDGRFKLAQRNGDEWLYDLERDPLEQHRLAVGDTPEAGPHVAALRDALAFAAARETAGGPPPLSAPPPAGDAATKDLEDRLRLLGYL